MKVALVTTGQENLGVEYLSSVIKSKGHKVRLFFDPQTFGGGIFLKIDFLKRKLDLHDKVTKKILEWGPDIVGFSCMTHNYQWSLQVARGIKDCKNTIPIIFGGIHPTSVPEEVLSNSCVDMVALGEGEASFVELLHNLNNNKFTPDIKGIYFKYNGGIVSNPPYPLIQNLDSLPHPDKQIFYDKIPAFKDDPYSIMASRGCPFSCTYCCNNIFNRLYKGQKIMRHRSVGNVIEELGLAKKKFDIPEVFFQDDIFPYDLPWLEEFSERYKKEINLPFQIIYYFNFSSEEHIKLLKSAGCYFIALGLQSGSERIRREVCNRFYSNETVRNAIKLCKSYGIIVKLELIFGLPFETKDEFDEAVEFYRELSPELIYPTWLVYYPATAIIKKGKEAGLLSEEDIKNIHDGRQSFYHRGTSIKNRKLLLTYQFLFDLIPLLPNKIHRWLTANKKILKLLPKGYFSHFFLVLLTNLKLRKTIFLRSIALVFARKYVP